MQCVKQEGINYQFVSLWYDSTWDWTAVIGEYYQLGQWVIPLHIGVTKRVIAMKDYRTKSRSSELDPHRFSLLSYSKIPFWEILLLCSGSSFIIMSLILSRHFSLSFIASGRSSGLHPISSHSICMYVRAGHPAFAWPYAGVHRGTSLLSSSLLLQQCPTCLVRLTCIVFVMGGRWPYSWCLVGCYHQDFFNISCNILV